MSGEGDAALRVVVEEARTLAGVLKAHKDGVCNHHGDLAKGVSLALTLLVGLYEKPEPMPARAGGLVAMGASLGIPTPICVLVWCVGSAKGWW